MAYLWICAIVSLVFGLLFIASPAILGALGSIFNAALFTLNGWLMRYRFWLGLLLVVVGAWLFYIGLQYPEWYITTAWVVAIVFGLLFLFLPNWLTWLSNASDSVLLSTDNLAMGWRRIIGIALVVAGIYIVYALYCCIR
jgi:hypothetical protein